MSGKRGKPLRERILGIYSAVVAEGPIIRLTERQAMCLRGDHEPQKKKFTIGRAGDIYINEPLTVVSICLHCRSMYTENPAA